MAELAEVVKAMIVTTSVCVAKYQIILLTYAVVAELADALDLGSSGRPWGFKSSLPHQ